MKLFNSHEIWNVVKSYVPSNERDFVQEVFINLSVKRNSFISYKRLHQQPKQIDLSIQQSDSIWKDFVEKVINIPRLSVQEVTIIAEKDGVPLVNLTLIPLKNC